MSVESKKQKQLVIDEIKSKFDKATSVVVVDYIGIDVEEANQMRKKLRAENVDYSVYKNTLVKRAISGTEFEELSEVLTGPNAVAFSYEDPTVSARILNSVMKEMDKMEFKAGIVEGQFFGQEDIKAIANIPSKDVLIAKFMGSIQSPISKLVRTFQAVADSKA